MARLFKTALKKITHSSFGQFVIAAFCWSYIKGVVLTSKISIENEGVFDQLRQANQPFIVCFWHCQLLMMGCAWKSKKPFYMLISNHADGRIISKAITMQGFETIGGSTGRGGIFALKRIIKLLKGRGKYYENLSSVESGSVDRSRRDTLSRDDLPDNSPGDNSPGDNAPKFYEKEIAGAVGVTPDGPRGPAFHVSDGTVFMAKKSQAPIVPLTYRAKRKWVLSTWDKFIIPKFFNDIIFTISEPISCDGLSDSEVKAKIAKELNSSF